LKTKDVGQIAIKALGPKTPVHLSLSESNPNSDLTSDAAHAALDQIADAEFLRDRLRIAGPCFESKR